LRGPLTNLELADIELDDLAYESVPVYRDRFCRVIDNAPGAARPPRTHDDNSRRPGPQRSLPLTSAAIL